MAPARGFTYLGLIILLAILALVAAAGLKMGTLLQRAAAEEELLEIGAQFSEALRSYATATPPGMPPQPPTLQDLLKDPRFPNPRRHLRKIFVDPVTGKAEWGIIWLGDKVGVLGVHSLSDARPLKIANFDIRFLNMENREKISDWRFLISGGEGGVGSVAMPPNSMIGGAARAGQHSLFAPVVPSADESGGKPGVGTVAEESKEAAPPAPVPEEPLPPEEPAPEEIPPVEPTAEEIPPVEPTAEEEKTEEAAKPVEPSTIVTPPPPPRPARRY